MAGIRNVSVIKDKAFHKLAREMRAQFDRVYADPLALDSRRFVWDPWCVPGQYHQLRTPAHPFFPGVLWSKFLKELGAWGQRRLGCVQISHPWMSLYLGGMHQHMHSDAAHGPWAFVLSLCPQPLGFEGGNTQILKRSLLEHWPVVRASGSADRDQIVEEHRPTFGQLLVFDASIPHAVSPVSPEVTDPRKGRLVIHGWFTGPQPYVEGAMNAIEVDRVLRDAITSLGTELSSLELQGILTIHLSVAASGRVTKLEWGACSLHGFRPFMTKALLGKVSHRLGKLKFPKKTKASRVTIPLMFELENPELHSKTGKIHF